MRTILGFAFVGVLIAIGLMIFEQHALPAWTGYLWPSYVMLGGTINDEWSFSSLVLIAISILANGVLYAVAGSAVTAVNFLVQRLFRV